MEVHNGSLEVYYHNVLYFLHNYNVHYIYKNRFIYDDAVFST